jgi:hypothetical protein
MFIICTTGPLFKFVTINPTQYTILQNTLEQYLNVSLYVMANPGHPEVKNLYIIEGTEACTLLVVVSCTSLWQNIHGNKGFLFP